LGLKSFFKRKVKIEEKKVTTVTYPREKEEIVSNDPVVPCGCKNYLGYLNQRSEKSSKIPEECISCVEVLNCLIHQHNRANAGNN
jgi:hypothetical protein